MRRAKPAEVLARVAPEPAAPAPEKPERKKPGRQGSRLKRAIDEVLDRFVGNKDGDWSNATPATLLGLYAYLHNGVYGVAAEELADDWMPAFSSARRFLEKQFEGDPLKAVACIKWSWQRERRNRKRNPDSDWRMGWRYQFSQKLVTDYRVAQQRD
jgi:hypothetical protein